MEARSLLPHAWTACWKTTSKSDLKTILQRRKQANREVTALVHVSQKDKFTSFLPRRNWVTCLHTTLILYFLHRWTDSHIHTPERQAQEGIRPTMTLLQLLLESLRKSICRCRSRAMGDHLCHEGSASLRIRQSQGLPYKGLSEAWQDCLALIMLFSNPRFLKLCLLTTSFSPPLFFCAKWL